MVSRKTTLKSGGIPFWISFKSKILSFEDAACSGSTLDWAEFVAPSSSLSYLTKGTWWPNKIFCHDSRSFGSGKGKIGSRGRFLLSRLIDLKLLKNLFKRRIIIFYMCKNYAYNFIFSIPLVYQHDFQPVFAHAWRFRFGPSSILLKVNIFCQPRSVHRNLILKWMMKLTAVWTSDRIFRQKCEVTAAVEKLNFFILTRLKKYCTSNNICRPYKLIFSP